LNLKSAFPDEVPLKPEQYLEGGSKEVILKVATFFLGFKSHDSEFENNQHLLKALFCEENQAFAARIYEKIVVLENGGIEVGIINPYCSLILFELYFSRPEIEATQTDPEFERNLFKAYLAIISQLLETQKSAVNSTLDLENPLKTSMMMFCMHYPMADKMNFDIKEIWVTQCIKAIYLFQFLETNPRTQNLLSSFLSYFNRPNWQEYLKSLISLTFSAIRNDREAQTDIVVSAGENFEEHCSFIEKLIIQENDALDENDFLSLRAKPFYKVSDGVYRIIFNLFVVEKIFKGVYFMLRKVNDELPVDQKVNSLKGLFGLEFSERTLLYKVMEIIYSHQQNKFTGKQLDDLGIVGAPDYYLRKGKKVLLFESKDFLIKADLKTSFDFDIYDKEFSKTLYFESLENGGEKAGAVMQLIRNIKKLLCKEFTADTNYHYKDIFIYPVLITHDHQYDLPGLSDLVNDWLQEELSILESEGFFVKHVKPLVIVNIDSLIYNQIGLAKAIPLHEVLDAYLDHVKIYPAAKNKSDEEAKGQLLEKAMPFASFIDNYFKQKGLKKIPPLMDFIVPELFSQDHNNEEHSTRSYA
jgi:hypothetical protein